MTRAENSEGWPRENAKNLGVMAVRRCAPIGAMGAWTEGEDILRSFAANDFGMPIHVTEGNPRVHRASQRKNYDLALWSSVYPLAVSVTHIRSGVFEAGPPPCLSIRLRRSVDLHSEWPKE